eukprot:532700_1
MMIDMTQLKFLDVEAADGVTIALLYMKLKMMMMDDDESEDDDEPEDESNSNSQPSDWDVSDGVSVHNLSYSDDEPNDNKDDDEQNDNKQQEANNVGEVKLLDIGAISIAPEKFDSKKTNETIEVSCGGSVLKTTEEGVGDYDVPMDMGAFGSNVCKTKEQIYHWKVQIVEGNDIHLGVIFSNKCKKTSYKSDCWSTEEGYSYCSNGKVYHSRKYKKYGKKYGAGDVIDVWLNLKKYNISFAKNDEKYGT